MRYIFSRILKIISFFIDKNNYFSYSKSQSENQENKFILKFHSKFENKNFLEIGFHWFQFNCIGLIENNFKGFLIDGGGKKNIIIMKLLCFFHNFQVQAKHLFVDKKNISNLVPKQLGILSIDIDGNDFWVLKEIVDSKVEIEMIVVEYNASLLDKCITVPYDKNFDRHKKHKSGMYHGASLKAYIKLLSKHNYCLVKTIGGINAFFVKQKLLSKFNLVEISFNEAYEENTLRNKWSNTSAKDQFRLISELEYLEL